MGLEDTFLGTNAASPNRHRRRGGGGKRDDDDDENDDEEKSRLKFFIRPRVEELCSALGVGEDEEEEEDFDSEADDFEDNKKGGRRTRRKNRYAETSAAVLANMVSEFSVTRGVAESSKRRLLEEAEKRGNKKSFESLYETLKSSTMVPELDRWNAVVAKIAADEELKEAVKSSNSGSSNRKFDVLDARERSP